jgi:hypothetical protein
MFHSSTIEPTCRILEIPKSLSKTLAFVFNLNKLACCDTCRSDVGTRCHFRNRLRSEYHMKKIHKSRNTNIINKSLSDFSSISLQNSYFFHGATAPSGPGPPHYQGFKINLTHTTFSRTPLDEWSARRRDNTQHSPQTSAPRRNSKPQSQKASGRITHTLDRAANGLGFKFIHHGQFRFVKLWILFLIRLVLILIKV